MPGSDSDDLLKVPITEPISPELVLVDPELAARARAQLPLPWIERVPAAAPLIKADSSESTQSRDATGHRRRRRRPGVGRRIATPILVVAAGALTPVVLSLFSSDDDRPKLLPQQQSSVASPDERSSAPPAGGVLGEVRSRAPGVSRAREQAVTPRRKERRSARRSPARDRQLASAAEKMILTLLPSAPRRKVPASLVDRRLRVVRTNVQVVCRPTSSRDRLRCIVRPARHRAGEGLSVSYRALPGGGGSIVWGRYRR